MPASFAFGLNTNAPTSTSPDAITCAGTAQATATALTGSHNVLTTAAGETACVLPAKYPVGSPIVVRNNTATAALVFPPVGGAINGGSANASFSVAQNKPTIFLAAPNGLDWVAVLSA
jgi:hypothetical protein